MRTLRSQIGLRIRKRASEIGLTQSDIAIALDTSRDSIAKLYAGKKRSLTFDQLVALCDLLDMPADSLLGRSQPYTSLSDHEFSALMRELEDILSARIKKS